MRYNTGPRTTISNDSNTLLRKSTWRFLGRKPLMLVAEITDHTLPVRVRGRLEEVRSVGALTDRKHFFALINHNRSLPLAMNSQGLRVTTFGHKLRMEVPLDVVTKMQGWPTLQRAFAAYEVRGMSFGWAFDELRTPLRDRDILSIDANEVSIVVSPERPALPSWCCVYEPFNSISELNNHCQRKKDKYHVAY